MQYLILTISDKFWVIQVGPKSGSDSSRMFMDFQDNCSLILLRGYNLLHDYAEILLVFKYLPKL